MTEDKQATVSNIEKNANYLKDKYISLFTKKEESETEREFRELSELCKSTFSDFDPKLLRKAFYTCIDVHKNKYRKSGEEYYKHPLTVAKIVITEIPLDFTSVISALLHDVLNETEKYSFDILKQEFGKDVANIVDGINKIKYIEKYTIDRLNHLEKYRKLILSLFKDVRIILIKLADRLHNMRTLEYLSPEMQHRIAKETMEIYSPFANRFGIRSLKWELEDLSFKILNHEEYNAIKNKLASTRQEREQYIENLKAPIIAKLKSDKFLKRLKIECEIKGRAKHIYSIFNKMKARQKNMDELYDLFAARIIVDTDDPYMCFYVYGLIAAIYPPVPETFKDYISSPKKNGYQSIHTGLIGPGGKAVEVQIRTRQMHDYAENGVAAHFVYKSGIKTAQSVMDDDDIKSWVNAVREIFENIGEHNSKEVLEHLPKGIFTDEILVFTPTNEFRSLPKYSTPLDFAFDIHSEIGFSCIGAKVNGKIVPLDYTLQNGDRIEILTSKKQAPNPDWLKYTTTNKAKQIIHKYIKDCRLQNIDNGKMLFEATIKKESIRLEENEKRNLIRSFNLLTIDDFYHSIGNGELSIDKAIQILKFKVKDGFRSAPELIRKDNSDKYSENTEILSDTTSLASCCNPKKEDKIVAIRQADGSLKIHKRNCPEITDIPSNERLSNVEIDWNLILSEDTKDSVLHIKGEDRASILNEITNTILEFGDININKISFDTNDAVFEGLISINFNDINQISHLIERIYEIRGVESVKNSKN